MKDSFLSVSLFSRTILVIAAATFSAYPAKAQQTVTASTAKPVFHDGFEREMTTGWDFTDPSAWRITTLESGKNKVLELFRASKYEPSVRSPFNIALARNLDLADFVMDVKVRSTTRDYGHRDLCLFFGHQDPSHFYYVHLGKAADEHANSI